MTVKISCKVTYGHIAGYGFSGRGYAIYRDGVKISPVCPDRYRAWQWYRSVIRLTEAGS